MHGFGLHLMGTPGTGMNCLVRAWNVSNTTILATVVNMWRLAASNPSQKETGPSVVMHGHGRAGRNTDFKHAYECVFKNDSVALGCSLDSVEAVGET